MSRISFSVKAAQSSGVLAEAAYSRWRAGELALDEGRDVLARRLLRRAHAQARGHVPLLGVVDRSRALVPDTVSAAQGGPRVPKPRAGAVRKRG